MFVHLVNLSFSYADSVPILGEVNIPLAPGWTGIVGANGAGKTTLLRLITGELKPTGGHVRLDPPSSSVAICPQTVETLTRTIEGLAHAADRVSRRIHGELALNPGALARWPTLSPGERKRWQVGAALAEQPSILILDEPTDHLDADARELLLAALVRFRGIGIVVSHDRTLLEHLTTYTIRVHNGSASIWRGPYGDAKCAWEAEEHERHDQYERLKEKHATLKRRLGDKRRLAMSAESQWNAGAAQRMRGPRDHDATSMAARGKAEMGSRRLSRDAAVLRRSVDRVSADIEQFKFVKEKGRAVIVDYVPAPASRISVLDTAILCAGEEAVLTDVHVVVNRDDKIRVAGGNGAGKTTLLNALVAASHLPADRILHLPQELTREDGIAILKSIRVLPAESRSRVLTLAAALGLDPARVLASQSPSPGEARKLALADGLGRQVWACVLDEPSNHLDMPAIERLEDALAEYPGALVMVTHEEPLAARVTREEWRVESGQVRLRSR
jgi:ATPase subunit of ABC transporter with duplicated ATPase domains